MLLAVDNQIDQTTGTVRLKATFDNRDRALFPSQFVNVQILADVRRNQIVIPAAAVQQGPEGAFVYAAHDGQATVRPVTVGAVSGDLASITGLGTWHLGRRGRHGPSARRKRCADRNDASSPRTPS